VHYEAQANSEKLTFSFCVSKKIHLKTALSQGYSEFPANAHSTIQ